MAWMAAASANDSATFATTDLIRLVIHESVP